MICNRTETGWEIIYQRAHALLAAKLATNWKTEHRPLRWTETLNAIAQHDNGWQEWEGTSQLTPIGTPRTYDEMELPEIVTQARRVVTRARHQSLWVALLIVQHVQHLYAGRRDNSRELAELLDQYEQLASRWCEILKVDAGEVARAYALLLWADTFSLTLCLNGLPFGGRRVEIGAGPEGRRYDAYCRTDGAVVVEPWPYEVDAFRVAVDTHRLSQLTFDSNAELERALEEAAPDRLVWQITNGEE